ncbi:MAG TPA: cation-translocating P-type ATPase [Acidimicrobiia bacterium]|nr:cation-translocating P-type ATPase [Acidimicrobiia bacterium]
MIELESLVVRSEPWQEHVAEVASRLDSDVERGLNATEAAGRLARCGPNRLDTAPPVPKWRKFLGQFADPLIYVLVAAVAVSLAAWLLEGAQGVPFEVIVIAVILAANGVLGYVQQARAEQAVAALQRMAAATACVVRDDRQQPVPATELVPGDVVVLAEGDAVSADARLIEAASLTVAEAALTGESEPVLKNVAPLTGTAPLGDRLNMVWSGTAVTRGRGRALVTATGMATEMGNVARLLGQTEEAPTPLQREVEGIGRALGMAVMVIAVVVVAAILLTTDIDGFGDVVDVLLVGVSLAVAAVPEGLPAVLSVVLALGVQRMARQRAIVKKLSSVETLGSASVVCSDKTGTLTRNEMTIVKVATPSGEVDVTGSGYRPEGELRVDGGLLDNPILLDEVTGVLVSGSLTNDADLRNEDGNWTVQGDPTDAAFLVAEAKLGLTETRRTRFERIAEIPFTSERRLMTTLQRDRTGEGRVTVVTKGAPDVLVARCTAERVAGRERPLTDARRSAVLATVDRLADQALRTLAVAYRPLTSDREDVSADESVERDLVYLGVVGIIDPPREEARASIAEARAAGVRVVMITGDHPRTAARIAGELGIVDSGARALTGVDLDGLDDAGFAAAVRETSVYARVAPEHKLRIVNALQADGHIVAMTGDGVNDAPALKRADIGVAMGRSGTDVANEAADMILADDNFATIVTAVREGRAIFANIRRFLRFLLSSNIGEVLTMFFGVVLSGVLGLRTGGESLAVPLLATQILWINLLTDGAPALAIGLDPPPRDVMDRRPRRLRDRVIDKDMWIGIVWVGVVMAVVTLLALDLRLPGGLLRGSGDIVQARTMAFTTLVLAQLFNCFNARSDRTSAFERLFSNPLLWTAIALSLALQVAVVHVPLLNDAFDTTPLGISDWLTCASLASAVLWADELKKVLGRRRRARVQKIPLGSGAGAPSANREGRRRQGDHDGFEHEGPDSDGLRPVSDVVGVDLGDAGVSSRRAPVTDRRRTQDAARQRRGDHAGRRHRRPGRHRQREAT